MQTEVDKNCIILLFDSFYAIMALEDFIKVLQWTNLLNSKLL